jgi:hypothetical protein
VSITFEDSDPVERDRYGKLTAKQGIGRVHAVLVKAGLRGSSRIVSVSVASVTPVAAPSGNSQIRSCALIRTGLLQMAS